MIALIVYLLEDEKLRLSLDSLKKFSPEVKIVLKRADPKKNKVAEELYQEFFNSEEFTEDTIIWHPDMLATPNWSNELNKYINEFDVIGCKILYPNGIVNHYGGGIQLNGVGHHPHQNDFDIGLTKPLDCAYVTGPSMVVKKKVWNEIKAYDFQFHQYIDVDFCMQAREKGFSVGVVPVPLIHLEGEDGFKMRSPQVQQTMLQENWRKFVAKWMNKLTK